MKPGTTFFPVASITRAPPSAAVLSRKPSPMARMRSPEIKSSRRPSGSGPNTSPPRITVNSLSSAIGVTCSFALPADGWSRQRDRPGINEVERNDARDPFEVAAVVGYEDEAGLSAREREQDVVTERFRDSGKVQSIATGKLGQHLARSMPGQT